MCTGAIRALTVRREFCWIPFGLGCQTGLKNSKRHKVSIAFSPPKDAWDVFPSLDRGKARVANFGHTRFNFVSPTNNMAANFYCLHTWNAQAERLRTALLNGLTMYSLPPTPPSIMNQDYPLSRFIVLRGVTSPPLLSWVFFLGRRKYTAQKKRARTTQYTGEHYFYFVFIPYTNANNAHILLIFFQFRLTTNSCYAIPKTYTNLFLNAKVLSRRAQQWLVQGRLAWPGILPPKPTASTDTLKFSANRICRNANEFQQEHAILYWYIVAYFLPIAYNFGRPQI